MMRFLLFGFLVFAAGAAGAADDVNQLSFLAGCWQDPRGNEEQWMKPLGGTLFGMARTVSKGKTVFWEFHQIQTRPEGVVLIVQHAKTIKPVEFRAIRISESEVIFENPEHDFPQRILYRKQPDGGLFARIEGREKGKDRGVDFPMKRAKCE